MNNHWEKILFWTVCSLWFGACSSSNQEVNSPPPQVLSTVQPPMVITQGFASFLKEFPAREGAIVYDSKWLQAFIMGEGVREISPKDCERYIYGKSIISEKNEQHLLPADYAYYYVGRLPDNGQYITIVFTDLSDGDISTYLCTYQRDGQFISGIILQRLHELLPEQYNISRFIKVNSQKNDQIEIYTLKNEGLFQIDSIGNIKSISNQSAG